MMAVIFDAALKSRLAEVLSCYPVMLAYLYGSQASGQATPLSDVDIALVLKEGHYDPARRMRLELQIEDDIVRGCDIPEADVRAIDQAPLLVRGEVVTNGILLYSRDEEFRVEFETLTRKLYFDFLPAARMIQAEYFAHLLSRGEHG
jgi:predicted nucleotidyltransferase